MIQQLLHPLILGPTSSRAGKEEDILRLLEYFLHIPLRRLSVLNKNVGTVFAFGIQICFLVLYLICIVLLASSFG